MATIFLGRKFIRAAAVIIHLALTSCIDVAMVML
jgi:hypothetical protein